jgi:hypothetical protein
MKPVLGFTRSRRTKQMPWSDVSTRATTAHDRICGVSAQSLNIKDRRFPAEKPKL